MVNRAFEGKGEIKTSYSTGAVEGYNYIGGLVGGPTIYSNVTNSYWDTGTSGPDASAGGEGKTTAVMKQQDTYVDWDFDAIWVINESDNNGYPFLKWQGTVPPQTYAL